MWALPSATKKRWFPVAGRVSYSSPRADYELVAVARGVLWLVTASRRCPAQECCALAPVRRLANVSGVPHVACSRCSLLQRGRRRLAHTRSNPAPFHHHKPSREPVWEACVEARRPTRRVKPEPEPNWPKVCVITSSIIIAKALPFVRCTRRTSLLRLPSRTASPIVAEAAQQVQKTPRLSAGAARGSWPARPNINKCPRRMHPKRNLMD